MSIKSIDAQRELASAVGIPFNTHDAEHDDIIDAIEGCSDVIKDNVSSFSGSMRDIQYIVVAILIGLLLVAYKLS